MEPSTIQATLHHIYVNHFTLVVLAVIILIGLLKLYFRGTQYNIPNVDLKGKYAIVTGGNSGIGAQTVKVLCKLGCEVIIGARSKQTADELIKTIRKQVPSAKLDFISLDLASLTSIQAFAKSITFPQIDYLVNNAGLMAIPHKKLTKQGFEMQWGVNHLGHFYLTYHLWEKLNASSFFRIINVSSLAHKRMLGFGAEPKPDWENINFDKNYDPNTSYSRSKLYNVLFTYSLAQKIGRNGITACLHPGVVRTQLMREMMSDGIKGKILNLILLIVFPLWWLFSKSSYEGCQTTLYTLLSDGVESGEYYSDCKKSAKNSNVTKQNANKLWQISQSKLGIKFSLS